MLKKPCWKSISFSRSSLKIHSQNHKIKENPVISNTQKPRNLKTQTKPNLFQTINNKINRPDQLDSLNQTNTQTQKNPTKLSSLNQTRLIDFCFLFFWFHFLGLGIWFSDLIFWGWVFVLGFLYSASDLASASFDQAWKLLVSDSSSFWWVRSMVSKDESWARQERRDQTTS